MTDFALKMEMRKQIVAQRSVHTIVAFVGMMERQYTLSIHPYCLGDFDAEAGEADIMAFAGGDEADRMDAEVAQDLSAKPDVAPHLLARGGTARLLALHMADRYARRSLAQIDEHARA